MTPDKLVWINRLDGHMNLANTPALTAARITRGVPDVQGGEIGRDVSGEWTGVFKDNAMDLVGTKLPAIPAAQENNAFDAAMAYVASYGVTSVHSMGSALSTQRSPAAAIGAASPMRRVRRRLRRCRARKRSSPTRPRCATWEVDPVDGIAAIQLRLAVAPVDAPHVTCCRAAVGRIDAVACAKSRRGVHVRGALHDTLPPALAGAMAKTGALPK